MVLAPHFSELRAVTHLCESLAMPHSPGLLTVPGPLPVMSGLHLWAPRLLFIWQLFCLQVQAAQPSELSLNPGLLSFISLSFQPSSEHQKGQAQPTQSNKDVDLGLLITSEPPKKIVKEVSAHPPKSTEEDKPSFQQETPGQPTWEAGATALQQATAPPKHPEVTFPLPEPVQVQQSTSQPLDLELSISREPIFEADATGLQQATATPPHPEVTLPLPKPIQAQQLDVALTITPEPTLEADATALRQVTPPPRQPEVTLPLSQPGQAQQPTIHPLDLELTIAPQHSFEADAAALQQAVAPPKHPELTFPLLKPVLTQQPTNQHLHQELNISAEPTLEADATALQQATTPPKHSEVSFPLPKPVLAQQPTYQELHLELNITPKPSLEADATALQQATPPAKHPELTLPLPEPVLAQQPTNQHLQQELNITPESTLKTDATAPPMHPQVTTVLPPQPVQTQQPTLPAGSLTSLDLEVVISQQPETSETVPPITEQHAPRNICELCTCNNGTLSCTDLRSEQKLRSVPVLEPGIYNGTVTVLNLQGNAISHIDKDTWRPYHLVEKLNLSGNSIQELHTYTFRGLPSLQILDVSCNKIKLIERSAFETLPRLQYLNLGCNLITNVSFGTFQAWHGMKFLQKLILSHNPLTTVQDPYLLKLRALKYLDMGTTQVSLTTVDNIFITTLKLEKLILPRHLTCCLCQFKSNIEAATETVKLLCDTECLTNTPCDEELFIEGPFMKAISRRKKNSTELTVEPEKAYLVKNYNSSSSLMGLLMKMLSEQQEGKISKAQWDSEQLNARMQDLGEQEEEQPDELTKQLRGYEKNNKFIMAVPVIVVATFFIVIFCLIAICHRTPSKQDKGRSSRGSKEGSLEQMEEGGFWRRRPLWLRDIYGPLTTCLGMKKKQKPQDPDETEIFIKMERSEASPSSVRIDDTLDTAAGTGEAVSSFSLKMKQKPRDSDETKIVTEM
uniref:Leucine rich repeat containing 37A n=1 Tax=Molossus molossus TaxID=27622 RepID=A0A7J8CZJ8_MOLMO|nr:hypothetical protein HJG59_009472 [Molossus molossus]